MISTTFAPDADDEVNTVLPGPTPGTVYLAGTFNKIDGKGPGSVALLRVAAGPGRLRRTGSVRRGRPNDLRLSGGRLRLGGTFTTIGGIAELALATLDPLTGALDPYMGLAIAGTHNGGNTSVLKMDITPDGSPLMVELRDPQRAPQRTGRDARPDGPGRAAGELATAFYQGTCSSSFNSYLRDVDISRTVLLRHHDDGAYGGTQPLRRVGALGLRSDRVRVSATWVAYTGGDTTYAVAMTGAAVYVGGALPLAEQPLGRRLRRARPQASRPGIAALDPTNGLPLEYPRAPLGVGVFDLLATPTGLWMGSDTDYTSSQYHAKVAFFPLAGGTVVPGNHTARPRATCTCRAAVRLGRHPAVGGFNGTSRPTGTDDRQRRGVGVGPRCHDDQRQALHRAIRRDLHLPDLRRHDVRSADSPGGLRRAQDAVRVPHRPEDDIRDVLLQRPALLHEDRYDPAELPLLQPPSGIVNALVFSGGTNAGTGADWSRVAGMFQAGDKIYYSSTTDGALRSISFANGRAVAGTIQVVSGPAIDGIDWRTRGDFLLPSNTAPTAAFTSDCTVATCTFDAHASTDPDGFIPSYSWDFGDGTTGSGVAPVHTYSASGTVTVTLTVTDDQGATSTRTGAVSPLSNVPPTAAVGSSCLGRTCTFDSAGSSDSDGSIVSYAWDLGDGTSSTDAVVEHTYGANGTYTVSLLVTDDRGGTAVDTEQVSVTAAVAAVAFRDKAGTQVNASVATVRVPSTVRSGDGLLLFASVAGNTTIGDPSGAGWSRVGGPTTTGSLVTQMWQKVALAGDAGATASVTLPAAFKMTLELVAYSGTDQGSPVATASARGDVAATTDHATPTGQVDQSGTAVVSYWADKSSSTTAWTAPAGVSVRDTQLGTGSGRATSLVATRPGSGRARRADSGHHRCGIACHCDDCRPKAAVGGTSPPRLLGLLCRTGTARSTEPRRRTATAS